MFSGSEKRLVKTLSYIFLFAFMGSTVSFLTASLIDMICRMEININENKYSFCFLIRERILFFHIGHSLV